MQNLIEKLKQHNPRALSRAISLAENDPFAAENLFAELFSGANDISFVIGITGAPGVGKSTLIKSLIEKSLACGGKTAVLAVDPSSPFSGGAFLGDRLRINIPDFDAEKTFIRSLATRGTLGGLSPGAAISLNLLKYYGYDIIFIETAGAGQDEVDIMNLADCVAVLLVAGLGDDIQMMKSGIMEIADVFVVNKCGALGTDNLVSYLQRCVLGSPRYSGKCVARPEIILTEALDGRGTDKLWKFFEDYRTLPGFSEHLKNKKERQIRYQVLQSAANHFRKLAADLLDEVSAENILTASAYDLSRRIIEQIKNSP